MSSSQGVKTSTPESHAWARIPWRKLESNMCSNCKSGCIEHGNVAIGRQCVDCNGYCGDHEPQNLSGQTGHSG